MLDFLKSLFGMTKSNNIQTLIANGAVVIDVRSPQEFETGHYEDSKNIPLDIIEANIQTIKDFNKVVILCCASGIRSGVAKKLLESKGITQVHNAGSWKSI